MFPEWFITACYIGIGLVALILLVRIVLRRRTPAVGEDLSPVEEVAVTNHGSLRHDAQDSPQKAAVPCPKATATARSTSQVTWNNRRLFASDDETRFAGIPDVPAVEPDEVPHVDTSDYSFGALTPILAALLPESHERRNAIKKNLQTAGFYQPHAWQNLAAARYVAIVAPMVFFGFLLFLAPVQAEAPVLIMLVTLSILGWAVPTLYVRGRAADRVSQIERAMPDMLDMLNMCVSQGLTVPESLRRVSREIRPVYPDLARELNIVCEQAEIGTLRQALENFTDRIDVPDVHSFTSLLICTF